MYLSWKNGDVSNFEFIVWLNRCACTERLVFPLLWYGSLSSDEESLFDGVSTLEPTQYNGTDSRGMMYSSSPSESEFLESKKIVNSNVRDLRYLAEHGTLDVFLRW